MVMFVKLLIRLYWSSPSLVIGARPIRLLILLVLKLSAVKLRRRSLSVGVGCCRWLEGGLLHW